jgi:hypothetical protein
VWVVVTVTVAVDGGRPASGPGETAELASRYQAYVERKAASTRTTRERYSRLLERIASGEVDPKLLDRGLNWFWNAYGPEHALAISELTMHFLTEVVQLSYEQSRQLIDEMTPGSAEPVEPAAVSGIEPPEVDPAGWMTWFSRLVAYEEHERSAQRDALRAVVEQAATAEDAPSSADADITVVSQPSSAVLVERLASLWFDLLARLDSLNTDLGLRYLSTVVPDDRPDAIELAGEVGESVECRFVVSNDKPDTAAVQCSVTGMRREDGIGPAFDPAAVISPDSLQLPPDGSAQISCSIALTDVFSVGVSYLGELRVSTGDDPALRIPIRIRANEHGSRP